MAGILLFFVKIYSINTDIPVRKLKPFIEWKIRKSDMSVSLTDPDFY